MTVRRRTALLVLAACTAASTAGPALAADGANNVNVSLTSVGGTRQFDVLQAGSATTLSTLDLGTTGSQPFRTRVHDAGFTTLTKSYSVTATMSNLYLRRGDGTHDVATKVPSSQLSLSKGVLSADGLLATLLPQLTVSGVLPGCLALSDPAKTALGLSTTATTLTALLLNVTGPVLTLCNALGSAGAPASGTIDGLLQQVTTNLADVTKLPNALTNGSGRSFDAADYTQDSVAKTDTAASGAPAPTGVSVMQGASATALSTELVAALKTALSTALSGVPLVSATDTGATTSLARALGTVTSTTTQSAIAALTIAQQAAVLNNLPSTLLDPTLAGIKDITSNYYAAPSLSALRNAPVPGTYDGTLTLTFVQQ